MGPSEECADQRRVREKTSSTKNQVNPNTTTCPSKQTPNSKEDPSQDGKESSGEIKRLYYSALLQPRSSSTKNMMSLTKESQLSPNSTESIEQYSGGSILCCDSTMNSDVF